MVNFARYLLTTKTQTINRFQIEATEKQRILPLEIEELGGAYATISSAARPTKAKCTYLFVNIYSGKKKIRAFNLKSISNRYKVYLYYCAWFTFHYVR